jgi:trans-aconitate methyltransferase
MADAQPDPSPRVADGSAALEHWEGIYASRDSTAVSWYQPSPTTSLRRITRLGLAAEDPILDVGAGASMLVDELLTAGHRNLTVLDISERAVTTTRERLTIPFDATVEFLVADLLSWAPPHRYRCWHDRAVFHFLTRPAEQARYRDQLTATLEPGGYAVLGTFAADGPTHCSGLPVARYAPDKLAATLGESFAVLDTDRELHHTPDHREQPFTWLTLRRVDRPRR